MNTCVNKVTAALLICLITCLGSGSAAQPIIADHNCIPLFGAIADSTIDKIKTTLSILHGHTSHGSQITTGMGMLYAEDIKYEFNRGPGSLSLTEYYRDLGYLGDTSWVPITRNFLDNPENDFDVVMWSWCAGCSDNTEAGMNLYLSAMSGLESDYPQVIFVYMTGHLDGTGLAGNLFARNNQIRDYCSANGKVLYDFADIESYDPNGNFYPDDTEECLWCYDWCNSHECPQCGGCAHTHCFNCYQKAEAFWWLLSTFVTDSVSASCCLGVSVGNMDGQPGAIDMVDLTSLIDMLFISLNPVDCLEEADIDLSGQPNPDIRSVDVGDLTIMINHLFLSLASLPACP